MTVWAEFGESACAPVTLARAPMALSRDKSVPSLTVDVEAASREGRALHPELDRAMERYARGDAAAFAEVHRIAGPRVRSFLLRLCGQRELAEDLAQEVFLRMHRARGSFAGGAPVLPWALAIARNTYLDHTRRAKLRAPLAEDAARAHESSYAAGPAAQPDARVAARETAAIVKRALAAMPVSHREAFVLLRFEGLSVAEAAHVIGATDAAVKIRAFRAYESIRAALAAQDREEQK